MVFSYNSFQKAKYLNSANKISGNIYTLFNSVTGYFGLAKDNRELAEENARLRMLLENHRQSMLPLDSIAITESAVDTGFRFITAKVISNSVNRSFNYITLNKGRNHGVRPDQGIISARGVVGVIGQVSDGYAMGLSVLNRRWSISAKHQESGAYGSLNWPGTDYRTAQLTEIPLPVDIEPGDTIITSGYSTIFPEGILIGTIKDFIRPDGENYYSIDVQLSVDYKSLSHVEIVEIHDKEEINELEKFQEQ